MRRLSIIVAVMLITVVCAGAITGCGTTVRTDQNAQVKEAGSARGLNVVTRVVDGDTFDIDTGMRVRFIGINCPESDSPGGEEATEYTKDLLEGKEVRLQTQTSEEDRYGRLLRDVYLEGVFVNEKIVRDGYAVAVDYPPDTEHSGELHSAESFAESSENGLWSTMPDAMRSLQE